MKSFISRCLPLLLVSLLTSTAFNVAHAADDELPVDDLVSAFRNLDQSISRGQLQQAESQLASLRQRAAGDTRLEQYQRQLAENHLQQGQTALQNGDLNGASASLGKARGLLPQAPALTSGLDNAIAKARAAELAAAEVGDGFRIVEVCALWRTGPQGQRHGVDQLAGLGNLGDGATAVADDEERVGVPIVGHARGFLAQQIAGRRPGRQRGARRLR